MASRYRALLIGNSTYPADEHNLQPLKGPAKDIAALQQALADSATGLFTDDDVTPLPEASSARALRAMGAFFGGANRDDVLLLYFSGHGKLDQSGKLHLCMADTETTHLLASAVSSTRINEFVEASRARNVVIVLDCCYAGAFRGADLGDAVSGPGRYVLTSCRGTQLANDATDDNGTSYFTQHLVDGLTHAAEDQDGDGFVSFSDLYAYVDRELRSEGKQIPQRRVDGDGDLRLARRAIPEPPTEEPAAASAQAATALAPPTPNTPSTPRRTRTLVVAAVGALVVLIAATATGLTLYLTRGTGGVAGAAATHPTSGTYTATGPWRLSLHDAFVGADPGCSLSLIAADTNTPIPLPTRTLYSPTQWQIHQTGTMRWQVNDPHCVVTPLNGVGSLPLPTSLKPTYSDSDAFAPGSTPSLRVDDFNGSSSCMISLFDAATGALLSPSTTLRVGQEGQVVALHPGSATTAYVNPDGCGVTISATHL